MKFAVGAILSVNVLGGGGHAHHGGHHGMAAAVSKDPAWSTITNKVDSDYWLVEKYGVKQDMAGENTFWAVTEVHANPTSGNLHNNKLFTSFLTVGDSTSKAVPEKAQSVSC